jgi:hypothetical protein
MKFAELEKRFSPSDPKFCPKFDLNLNGKKPYYLLTYINGMENIYEVSKHFFMQKCLQF